MIELFDVDYDYNFEEYEQMLAFLLDRVLDYEQVVAKNKFYKSNLKIKKSYLLVHQLYH